MHANKRKQTTHSDERPAKQFALASANYLQQGDAHVEQGHYEQAINAYSAALAIDPQLSVYLKRSQAYQTLGKMSAAKWDCLHALWRDASDEGLQDWLSQLVPADFTAEIFVDEQLVLFRDLLLAPDESLFVQHGRAILLGNFTPDSWDSEITHRLGYNLLHLAVCIGDERLVKALHKHGARLDAVNPRNQINVLYIAAYNNHLSLVSYLLQHTDVNQANKNGVTPLCIAAHSGHLEVVKYLVTQGKADVNQAYEDGATPLCVAAQEGHLEVVKFLVAQGKADVNQACEDGATALNIAAQEGHLEVVKYLVTQGKADVNQACEDGATPLYIAAQEGHLEVVKYLVKTGQADVYQAALDGVTALHSAIYEKHMAIIQRLIIAGALAESQQSLGPLLLLKAKDGYTPLDDADNSIKQDVLAWHQQRFFLANDYRLQYSPSTCFQKHHHRFFVHPQKQFADCDIRCSQTSAPRGKGMS
jgi:ankyrin repeat protein